MKKFLSLFLAVLMIMSVVPMAASAAVTEYTQGYYTYVLDSDGYATITDVDESISGSITIPFYLDGHEVRTIGNSAFNGCKSLVNVTVSRSVQKIGNYAFRNTGLRNIAIPYSVKIGTSIFYQCDGPINLFFEGDSGFFNNNAIAGLTSSDKRHYKESDTLKLHFEIYFNLGIHVNLTSKENVSATCTEDGNYAGVYCEDCGSWVYKGGVIPASHQNIIEHEEISATCTESGHTAGDFCDVCNTWLTGTEIPATNHSNKYYRETSATCTEYGYKGNYCPDCENWIDLNATYNPTGHTKKYVAKIEATCGKSGYEAGYVCTVCGEDIEGREKIDATGNHVWNSQLYRDGTATCVKAGSRYRVCKVCDYKLRYGSYYDTGKHENTGLINVKEPTCAEEGYTGDNYCYDCESVLNKGKAIPATGNHDYSIILNVEPANCHTREKTYYKCSLCTAQRYGYSSGGYDLNNHKGSIGTRNAAEATCTSAGYTGDKYCTGCWNTLEAGTTIPAKGHSYSQYYSNSDATCTSDGSKTAYCDNGCWTTNTVTDVGSKKAHTDNNHDGRCDSGCGYDFTSGCGHLCHKGGFLYKFCLFFWKLFKIQRECSCGMYHY